MDFPVNRRKFLQVAGATALATSSLKIPSAQAAPTKITYWAWSEHVRGAKAVYPKFQQKHPDIEVDIINLNPQEIQDKMLIALTTGVGAPDVALIIEKRFPTYPQTGGLLDVTKSLAGLESQYEPRLWARLHYEGKAYGVPYINNSAVVFYRRDIFEKAGLTAPIDTWPEWIEAGKKVRAMDSNVYMHQVSGGVAGNGPLDGYMESAGVQYFDEKGKTIRNNKAAADVLRFYFDLVKKHDIALLVRHNSPEYFVAMKTGKLAALHSGNWGLERIESESPENKGKWGVMPWPKWSNDAPATTGTWGGSVLAIPKSGKNIDATVKWATFLGTNVDAQVGLWQSSYGYPTNLLAQKDPRMLEAQSYLGQSMYEASLKPRETKYFNLIPDWPRVQVAMGRQLDLMFKGDRTPEQAWADFEAEMAAFTG
jgi:ABC-type glycerol-3-phosphate transport system substrate-binding protein